MESKSKNSEMEDFGKKLNQKFGYGMICRRSMFVGLICFVVGDSVGYWVSKGFIRGREIKAEN